MHFASLLTVAWLLPVIDSAPTANQQQPLDTPSSSTPQPLQEPRTLQGRFLHITDLHPDPYYKVHAATDSDRACHRGTGSSGKYGAETSDCDSPFALINATFTWIAENLRDTVDFVVWTGDSARHDSDEEIPRTADEVLDTNAWVADKFLETFGKAENPEELEIPIISTFGNNDILPHNILLSGPNKWLKAYSSIWSKFIPEEQRHGFERGGWYYVEVIPGKLAVFSLNTLYFFDSNAAVDGCVLRSEPGYEQMEWLRIQLQFMRERGMKAILMGHVPPARTDSKKLWDETCWQKYTLWLRQYRDVVIGGLYGHMNLDHFMFQDSKEITIDAEDVNMQDVDIRTAMDDELTIQSANDYLEELRKDWSDLPNPKALGTASIISDDAAQKKSKKDKKREKAEKKLGGPWAERFQLTHVAPSLVPNYFPTLRIVEYNITGLDKSGVWSNPNAWPRFEQAKGQPNTFPQTETDDEFDGEALLVDQNSVINTSIQDDDLITEAKGKKDKKNKKKKDKKKKPSDPDLTIPDAPSKSTPPGPGYSPQTLTLLGYTQYYANLTHINNDFVESTDLEDVGSQRWHEGKHKGKKPANNVPHPNTFQFEVEYDTMTDPIYKLKDMTVKSYIKLARRIGKSNPDKGALSKAASMEEHGEMTSISSGKKHKEKNKVWLSFVSRAFVSTLEEEDLDAFKRLPATEMADGIVDSDLDELHDGEL